MDHPKASSFARRLPAILGGIGVLLGIAALIIFISLPEESVGDVAAIEDSLIPGEPPAALPPVVDEDEPTDTAVAEPEDNDVIAPNEVGRLDQLDQTAAPSPTRLIIDGISVDAPVEPYGINSRTGQMEVPRNVRDVAWYEYGPSPGQPGSAVLAAHVDLSSQGPGVFYRLRDLEPGDQIAVEYDDETTAFFVVEARVKYDKDELPLETVFSRDGEPVLTLITCGGGFSPSAQSYDSNVVVYAVPLDAVDVLPDIETA
jgi:LPXTG-site transpeptidase (sortase) family protein